MKTRREQFHCSSNASDGDVTIFEWIPGAKGTKGVGYLRLENMDKVYLGSPSERQLKKLFGWLKEHFKESK